MKTNYTAGFTLIELMVVVAILAIVSAIALPSYSKYIANSRIRNAAESIQNGLQKARSEAVSKNASVIFTLGVNSAWTVGCVTVVTADNNGDGAEDCPFVIEEHISTDGASLTINYSSILPAAATTVTFTSLGTRATGGITEVTIDNSALSSADSSELKVIINGANVRMCNPNLPAGNLRAC